MYIKMKLSTVQDIAAHLPSLKFPLNFYNMAPTLSQTQTNVPPAFQILDISDKIVIRWLSTKREIIFKNVSTTITSQKNIINMCATYNSFWGPTYIKIVMDVCDNIISTVYAGVDEDNAKTIGSFST